MTQAVLRGGGSVVDYTPLGAVSAGDVIVQGALIGIALEPIAAGEKGALAVECVADFTKLTGDTMAVGVRAYWNESLSIATTTAAGNVFLGKVVTGTTTETTVRIDMAGVGNAAGAIGWTKIASATVAATGTSSGDGPVAVGFTLVSAANGTKAVTLPAAAAGLMCILKNNAAANLLVFPATGDKINGGTATTGSLTMAQYTTAIFVAYDAVDWYSTPLLPS